VYQCKGKNLTFLGQCFLGLYFACHAVTKLTLTIAMFSTAEDSGTTLPQAYNYIFCLHVFTITLVNFKYYVLVKYVFLDIFIIE
jgi:hypothetical protein